MYPTLIIIVCAVDRSLYEKSADDVVRGFGEPSIRRCGTFSELLSASSAFVAAEDVGRPGERRQDVVKEAGCDAVRPGPEYYFSGRERFDKLVVEAL